MNTTPQQPDGNDPDDGEGPNEPGIERIYRFRRQRATGRTRWNVEMLEAPLMDRGLAYTVSDGLPTTPGDAGNGWIDFELPTSRYTNATGHNRLSIRLTVTCGRLAITAPGVYPPGSLRRTSDPPPDADGNLRIVRLGDEGETNLDLVMAADGTVTAVLQMETISRPFNRADIVHIAEEFAMGLDLLDFVVRKERLLLPRPGGSP